MGAMDPANHNHPHDWLRGEAVTLTPVRLTRGRGRRMSLTWLNALRGSDPASTECIFITLAKPLSWSTFLGQSEKPLSHWHVLP